MGGQSFARTAKSCAEQLTEACACERFQIERNCQVLKWLAAYVLWVLMRSDATWVLMTLAT